MTRIKSGELASTRIASRLQFAALASFLESLAVTDVIDPLEGRNDLFIVRHHDDGGLVLLLQRLPVQGQHNLSQSHVAREDDAGAPGEGVEDDFARLSILARSLRRDELLGLDADTILRRLFWEERLMRFEPLAGLAGPRFACSCSRARVAAMLQGLGQDETESIVREQGQVEVSCDFCGRQERFDAVDVARLFTPPEQQPPLPGAVQ